jgi:hypothetical protein
MDGMEGRKVLLVWQSLIKGVARGPKKKIWLCFDHFGPPPKSTKKNLQPIKKNIGKRNIF